MDLRKTIIAASLVCFSAPVLAVPVVAFLSSTAFTVAGVAITIGQVLFTAGSLLFGSAQQRKLKKKALAEQKRQKDEYNAGLSDRTVNGIGSEFPARHVFGTARIGGNIVDIITSGVRDEFQHLIVLGPQHQVEDFPEIYLNGKPVGALDVDGLATSAPFGKTVTTTETALILAGSNSTTLPHTPDSGSVVVSVNDPISDSYFPIPCTVSASVVTVDAAYVSQVKYISYTRQKRESSIRITKHLGVPGGSYDVNTNVETDGKLKTTSVFDGHAYLAIRLSLDEPEFQSLPAIEMLVKRNAMFDVRTGTVTTNAGTNPALVAHEYLKGPLCNLENITLPTAQYITAANDCDAIVNNGDGNRKRYTFNGMISSDQSREEVLQRIADSMAGGIVATTWDIYAGVYRAPVMSLNEADIVGSLSVTPGASELEIFNTVYGRFATAANAWLEKDYRRYVQSTYVAADGGELEVGITYPFTVTQTEVDQLNRIATEQARQDFTISAMFSLKAWKLKVGDRVYWTSPFMGQTNETYRVVDRSSGKGAGVTLMLKQDTPEMYDLYDAVALPTVPESTIVNPWVVLPPENLVIHSGDGALTPQVDRYVAGLRVSWTNATTVSGVRGNTVEVEATRLTGSGLPDFLRAEVAADSLNALITPAQKGETYRVSIRSKNVYTGARSEWVHLPPHIVVGKTSKPKQVQDFVIAPESALGKMRLGWSANAELDISAYEVREDTNFGTPTGLLWFGSELTCFVPPPDAPGNSKTYYIAALDYFGNYSATPTTVIYTYPIIPTVGSISHAFQDDSLTSAVITLSWVLPVTTFAIDSVRVGYDSITSSVKSETLTLPANWLGDRAFVIQVIDILGNSSPELIYNVTKVSPSPLLNYRSQVIDNTVMLFWNFPPRTTLPIDHVLLKKGTDWSTAESVGEVKTEFTTISELQAGVFTYWAAVVDTDNNESTPVSLTISVTEPPEFQFFTSYLSDFSSTLSNAIKQLNSVVLPVKQSETWQQHFTDNSWLTVQDQIDDSYPVYIQPSAASGYYEEVFDYGTILPAARVTLTHSGVVVAGAPDVQVDIGVSIDGVIYQNYARTTVVYASSFRYIKVRVSAFSADTRSVYRLNYLEVNLDSKKNYDALQVSALSSDTLGTIANFNREFLDVQTIQATPFGTTPVTPVIDFQDAVLSATYSVVSSVCTINYTAHGFIAGQRVQIGVSSGLGLHGVRTITSAMANSFTVAMPCPDTSGDCLVYPQSCRVYVFDDTGTRVSRTIALDISGF